MKALVMLALQVSIMRVVFGCGLRTTRAHISALFQRRGLLVRSLLSVFVCMPAAAVLIGVVLDLPQATRIALVALSISPVPPLLPSKERRAGGERSFGVALMAVLAMLAIVTVPLSVEFLAWMFGRQIDISLSAVAGVILKSTLLPLVAGMLVRDWWPDVAQRIFRPVGWIGKTLLPAAVLLLLAAT